MLSYGFKLSMVLLITACLVGAAPRVDVNAQMPGVAARSGTASSSLVSGVLFTQPPLNSGAWFQSSSTQNDYDVFVWDDFTLPSTQDITEIQWQGAYPDIYPGYTHPVVNFIIGIYDTSIANEPNVSSLPLIEYDTIDNANETLGGVYGGLQTYNYDYVLSSTFTAQAGTRYWVQIEAQQAGLPNWALTAASGGNGTHFMASVNYAGGYSYRWANGDTTFTLLGPGTIIHYFHSYLPIVARN